MASRNQRRRKARQRATTTQLVVKREAGHDVDSEVNPVLLGSISKAAQSRQAKTKAQDVWDPNKTVPPPLPPDLLWTIFESNSVHSGCINAKVADAVGRGWRLTPADPDQEGADDDAKKVARELEDLFESICPRLTFRQLMEQAARELDTIGWADWEVLRDRDGDVESEIVGILPVPAMSIRACKDSDDVFCQVRGDKKVYFKRFGFEQHVNCKTGEIADDVPEDDRANELVHFQHYTPRSSWYGIPPWVSAMPSIAEFAAIREFNVSYFESGGQADRHVHVAAGDAAVAEQLAGEVVQQLEDAKGEAHVTVVTHGDETTSVEVSSLEPKSRGGSLGSQRESDYRGGKADLKEEIRVAHQVPPGRLGIAEGGAMAGNANDSMDDDYRIGVVEPLQEILVAEIRRTILGEHGFGEFVSGWKWELEGRTQDDEQSEHDRIHDDVEKGLLTPNEARRKKGEDEVSDPALDRHYYNGQPISTDPAITEVHQTLAELRDALTTAAGAGDDGVAKRLRRGVFRVRQAD